MYSYISTFPNRILLPLLQILLHVFITFGTIILIIGEGGSLLFYHRSVKDFSYEEDGIFPNSNPINGFRKDLVTECVKC
jgi:hypothetical protein